MKSYSSLILSLQLGSCLPESLRPRNSGGLLNQTPFDRNDNLMTKDQTALEKALNKLNAYHLPVENSRSNSLPMNFAANPFGYAENLHDLEKFRHQIDDFRYFLPFDYEKPKRNRFSEQQLEFMEFAINDLEHSSDMFWCDGDFPTTLDSQGLPIVSKPVDKTTTVNLKNKIRQAKNRNKVTSRFNNYNKMKRSYFESNLDAPIFKSLDDPDNGFHELPGYKMYDDETGHEILMVDPLNLGSTEKTRTNPKDSNSKPEKQSWKNLPKSNTYKILNKIKKVIKNENFTRQVLRNRVDQNLFDFFLNQARQEQEVAKSENVTPETKFPTYQMNKYFSDGSENFDNFVKSYTLY